MLTMDEQNYVTALREIEGRSLRDIAAHTGYHFNTVKKYADKEDWNMEYRPRKQRTSGLDPLKPILDGWIREDLKRKRKHRRTATKMYNDMVADETLSQLLIVGRQTVTNYVSKRKKELAVTPYSTAMYTLHAMCEAQVDFGEVLVIGKNGAEEKWHILVLSFPWSNAGFMQVCRNETKECLCEALLKIFEHIGGVPYRILFDNMSSAVVHIEADGNRKLTEMFMRFTMHHRYKAEFCNPESPHEKGNVENKVGYLRRNYMLPPPKIENLETFNRELLEKCSQDLEREHYRKGEQISEMFTEEQKALMPLPLEPFRVFTLEKAKTDKYSLLPYDSNFYSTAPEYAECEMWLEVGANEIRILNEKYECVATHARKYGRHSEPDFKFEPYIPALVRKPRAFLKSPYFLTLPETLRNYLKNCAYRDLRKMLLVLLPIFMDDKAGDAAAVFELSEIRNPDDFAAAYRALTEDPRALPEVTTPLTPAQQPYLPKLTPYSALMGRPQTQAAHEVRDQGGVS